MLSESLTFFAALDQILNWFRLTAYMDSLAGLARGFDSDLS